MSELNTAVRRCIVRRSLRLYSWRLFCLRWGTFERPANLPALFLTGLLFCAPWAQAQDTSILLDRISVIVEDSLVMQSEVDERMEQTLQRLKATGTTPPSEDLLRSQVVEQLISERLLLQMAEREGIQVTDDELSGAMHQIAAQNEVSLEELFEQIESEGQDFNNFRNNLRRDMLIQRVQRARIGPRINITEEEIDWFLKSTEGESLLNREYLVHHILIPFDEDQPVARQKAELLLQQLNEGEDFESLAVAHSGARNALEGGSLGWRKFSQLPSIIAEQVRSISPGTIRGPISDGYAWHLIRLTDRRGDTVRYSDQWKVRHILMRPTAIRDLDATGREIKQLRQRIEQGEDFSSLANLYSDDPNSALAGGDLGWVELDQVPLGFTTAVEGLEEGGLSAPFQTDAGWHILQVMDQRNTDLTEETGRNIAHRLLYERKFEEAMTRFMHESRTQAYVQFKGDLAAQNEP